VKSLCVYCGSRNGIDARYLKEAQALGKLLADSNIRLVYGGGSLGLMGAISQAVEENGGQVHGILPEFLLGIEAINVVQRERHTTEIVPSMHVRKQRMFEESDAFLAMPGGIGTLEELVEMMTWAQLGRHEKPILLLNVDDFWSPFRSLIQHMEDAGFLHNMDRLSPKWITSAKDLISALKDTN